MTGKLEEITKNVGIPTIIAATSITDSQLATFFTFLYGVITTVGLWQKKRAEEVITNVGIKRIEDLILRDDKSRDILHRILQNIMDESSVKKRELFYSYIKNLHKNVRGEFDYHTKLISTINAISFEELHIFTQFARYYKRMIEGIDNENNKFKPEDFFEDRGVSVTEMDVHTTFTELNDVKLERVMNALSSEFGLIFARFGRMNGTFYGPLTEFGYIMRDFLKDEGES